MTGGASSGFILQFDVGNTRLKWRAVLSDGRQHLGEGALSHAGYSSVECLLADLYEKSIAPLKGGAEGIWVASVAAPSVADAIDVWARQSFGLKAEFARTSARAAGVEAAYQDYSRLGVDRWLAILAASALAPKGALVVDCGSAITVDVLQGLKHRGGYIVPGLRLMRKALFQDTEQVKVAANTVEGSLRPGRITEEAVDHGLPLMAVGLVSEVLGRLREDRWGWGCWTGPVYVTGGDAAVVAPMIREEQVYVVPDLVLDGLWLAERAPLSADANRINK